jgi:hypothetical protein
MMALTESSLVSLKAFIASVFEHFVYSITILMLSGESPSSEIYSPATSSTFYAVVVAYCGTY